MNNKGFTVVELLASFTLTMIIVVFLSQIVLELKDVYLSDTIKTKTISQNSLIATALNKKFDENTIIRASCSTTNSCEITYSDNSNETVKIENNKVIIGNQTFSMPDNTDISVDDVKYQFSTGTLGSLEMDENAYIKIAYIVESKYFKKPVKFSYTYSFSGSLQP